ncbi:MULTISPECIES: hypothetical protein [Achromobacter]|uniref:hypothetical protein n=1 Tax=Achromobacter TaxID=222 RepID=UPI0023F9CC29|nr:hypothetical protein [Achromobacter anxifer]MDF8363341.1 hypothetical protein [Achromobacter anxifer]
MKSNSPARPAISGSRNRLIGLICWCVVLPTLIMLSAGVLVYWAQGATDLPSWPGALGFWLAMIFWSWLCYSSFRRAGDFIKDHLSPDKFPDKNIEDN